MRRGCLGRPAHRSQLADKPLAAPQHGIHLGMSADLFQPARLGPITLPNRVVMAPLTRSRTGSRGIPGPMNAAYYAQRATAGLIIAEATQVSPRAGATPSPPASMTRRRSRAGNR